MVRTYTHIISFRSYTFQYQDPLILQYFLARNSTFTQGNIMRAELKIFLVLFLLFVRKKIIVNENVSFIDNASGFRILDGCKLATNRKNNNDVTIF